MLSCSYTLLSTYSISADQRFSDQDLNSRGENSTVWNYEKKSIKFASDYVLTNKDYGTGTPEQARPAMPRSGLDFPNQ